MTNGKLLVGLPIAVDFWKLPKSHEKFKTYLYFLTHLHTDHTKGLTSTWTETIYTSNLNRDLAIQMLNINPELIKPLELGVPYTLSLPLEHESSKSSSSRNESISVTLVDANHIKGSVMFLFEGFFGKVLYTGDFRWCESMRENALLRNLAETRSLNLLYVDNTFEEVVCEFPTREQCMIEVLQIIKKYRYHRIIFGCQTIGKEDVLLQAAHQRKEKVYVPETILKIYEVLGMPCDLFTTNQADSLIWFEKLHKITPSDLRKKNLEMPTIAIKLTASGFLASASKSKDDELIMTVPYSNHCSSSELGKFLDFLQPRLIERIVVDGKTPTSSIIGIYLATNRAELTEDSSSFSEASSLDGTPFKSQLPDYFHSAVSHNQSPKILAEGTEETALSEDMDTSLMGTKDPSISVAVSKPLSSPNSVNIEEFVENASRMISSINADLQQFTADYIYKEAFIEKLISLAKIYEPVTGIFLNLDD